MKKIYLIFCSIFVIMACNVMSQNDVECNRPIIKNLYETTCIRKNDTIFYFHIFKEKGDSVVSNGFATKLTKTKWITNKNSEGSYSIIKYKKCRKNTKKNKENASTTCDCTPKGVTKSFHPDGTILKACRFGKFIHVKKINPKKKK